MSARDPLSLLLLSGQGYRRGPAPPPLLAFTDICLLGWAFYMVATDPNSGLLVCPEPTSSLPYFSTFKAIYVCTCVCACICIHVYVWGAYGEVHACVYVWGAYCTGACMCTCMYVVCLCRGQKRALDLWELPGVEEYLGYRGTPGVLYIGEHAVASPEL